MRAIATFVRTLIACSVLAGCGQGFESPSRLDRVRVLAVRPEPASGAPGRTVQLTLLSVAEAPGPELAEPRELQIAWLGGCHNPPTRQYFACYPLTRQLASVLEERVIETDATRLPPGVFGVGSTFSFTVPDDILASAPRVPTDPVHFGVSYVFFAVCAGELRAEPHRTDGVPLGCVDPESGAPLDPTAFVRGYATLYSYEGVDNENPVLNGVSFDGVSIDTLPCRTDADCESLEEAAEGRLQYACSAAATCAPVLAPCPNGDCPDHRVLPLVDPASAERLGAANEVLWVNYYATAGTFNDPTQLVSDRQRGLIDDPSGRWKPARVPVDPVRLWVTLHDQRGGAAWTSLDVIVRE